MASSWRGTRRPERAAADDGDAFLSHDGAPVLLSVTPHEIKELLEDHIELGANLCLELLQDFCLAHIPCVACEGCWRRTWAWKMKRDC